MSSRFRLVFGVLFVAGALLCGVVTLIVALRSADRVQSLTPLTLAGVRQGVPGTEVLVEARISADNRVLLPAHGFVAYQSETRDTENYEGTPAAGSWSVQEKVTPPLLLEMAGGVPVEIINDDYELQDADSVEEGGRAGEYSHTRYSGLRAGEQVIAVGTIAGGKEIGRVQAEFIARGTQASYVEGQRGAGLIFAAVSLFVALAGGAIVLGGALFRLRR